MSEWLGLAGQRVVLAGAGGIGVACFTAFLDAGARVAVIDNDQGAVDRLCADHPGQAHPVTADLTDPAVARAAADEAIAVLGGVDVFVHAVGVNVRRPITEFDDAEWRAVIETNLSSAFWLGQAIGRVLCAQGSGRIIFLSSVAGRLAHRLHGPYAATKGGLDQLLRVMAVEWAEQGVTVNAVAPGYTETNLTTAYLDRPGVRDHLTSLVPAARLGNVADVVGPVLFLASKHAGFVTGQVLYVDGGRILV